MEQLQLTLNLSLGLGTLGSSSGIWVNLNRHNKEITLSTVDPYYGNLQVFYIKLLNKNPEQLPPFC